MAFPLIGAATLAQNPSEGYARRSAKGFDVRDDLPAALLGDAGPGRHAAREVSVAQEPCEFAGRRVLYSGRTQIHGMAPPECIFAVAFRAVLTEKFFTRGNCLVPAFVGIFQIARFSR